MKDAKITIRFNAERDRKLIRWIEESAVDGSMGESTFVRGILASAKDNRPDAIAATVVAALEKLMGKLEGLGVSRAEAVEATGLEPEFLADMQGNARPGGEWSGD